MSLQYYHFSIDDVLTGLLNASSTPASAWDQPLFSFLRRLHDEFATAVDLYLFARESAQADARGLTNVSSQLRSLFEDAPWIHLGPHALEPGTPPYNQTPGAVEHFCTECFQEIDRFAGPAARSHWVRFHYFSECFEVADYLMAHGVTTLLTTDKPAVCYRLSLRQREQLLALGHTRFSGLDWRRSHLRMEDLVDCDPSGLDDYLDQAVGAARCAVLLTHEYELVRPEVREVTWRALEWTRRRQLRPVQCSTLEGQAL